MQGVSMTNLHQFVVFSIDQRRFALPLPLVERTVRSVEVTPLPGAPEIVPGVVNVHGRIIPVVNIRRSLGLPEQEINLSDKLIIAHTSRRSIALLVEAVSGVLEYPEQEVVAADDILPGMKYIKSMVKSDDGMILILDPESILSFDIFESPDDCINKTPETE